MFPIIEKFRAELRSMEYPRINDEEQSQAKWDYDQAAHSGRIEGLERPGEIQALFDLMIEERVPESVAEIFFDRYAVELFGPAAGTAGRLVEAE